MIVHPVNKNVSYIEGRGGNIGVIYGEDGVLLIDDQYAPLTEKIIEEAENTIQYKDNLNQIKKPEPIENIKK